MAHMINDNKAALQLPGNCQEAKEETKKTKRRFLVSMVTSWIAESLMEINNVGFVFWGATSFGIVSQKLF